MADDKKTTNPPEKVVKGKVTIPKKTLGEKLAETFVMADLESVLKSIVSDTIVPKVKSTICDIFESLPRMLLYGDGKSRPKGSGSSASRNETTPYYKYNRPSSYDSGYGSAEPSAVPYRRTSVENVEFENRSDAEAVLTELRERIYSEGCVSVNTFLTVIGRPEEHSYTKTQYGWNSLADARIEATRNGWVLKLPKPVYIG
jgi:hypothetical protein